MAEMEKYYYVVDFVVSHYPIETRRKFGFIDVPSVLHVNEAVKAKIRGTHPKAHNFEFQEVERADERFYARKTAGLLSINERLAVLVAHRQGYCRRSNTASETGAHWRVCNKLRERGIFTPIVLNEPGNPGVDTLKVRHGVLVAELLETWAKSR